mgnify:FL=1
MNKNITKFDTYWKEIGRYETEVLKNSHLFDLLESFAEKVFNYNNYQITELEDKIEKLEQEKDEKYNEGHDEGYSNAKNEIKHKLKPTIDNLDKIYESL